MTETFDPALNEEHDSARWVNRKAIYADAAEWNEGDHPRGQPENAGQFARSSSGRQRNFNKASQHGENGRVHESGAPLPAHIAALRIPPAWTNVEYNSDPDGALLVVGRDAKGREQRIYSPRFAGTQAEAKFRRIQELDRKFDRIYEQNEDARRDPRKRDVADSLALIMSTGIRPGSDEDTKAAKRAYGATTLEARHVHQDESGGVSLRFVGKKGVDLDIPIHDPDIARMLVNRARDAGAPGDRLFPEATASKLLDHVHSLNGGSFKTKDFRTLLGTRLASAAVKESRPPTSPVTYRKMVMEVAKKVAAALGNTPVVSLQSYIAPEVFSDWRVAAGA